MATLKGSRTHENLKQAFASESQANRRYLYFARQADVEGYPEIAGLFRDTAEGETGHAHGDMDFLKTVGDPVTDLGIGNTLRNLASAIAGGTYVELPGAPHMPTLETPQLVLDAMDRFLPREEPADAEELVRCRT